MFNVPGVIATIVMLMGLYLHLGPFSRHVMAAMYKWNIGAGIPFPALDPDALGRWGGDFYLFPNLFFLPIFGNSLMYRVRPDSTDPRPNCIGRPDR